MSAISPRAAVRLLRTARPISPPQTSFACTCRPLQKQISRAYATPSEPREDNTPKEDTAEPKHNVRYTTDSYDIKRDSKFAEIKSDHVDFFKSALGDDAAIIDGVTQDASDDIEGYNRDWMKKYTGAATKDD
jgi:(R)-2-hydroxyglutarate---pyruvate transhydrogenase